MDIQDQLHIIRESISLLMPELFLSLGILILIVLGFFKKIHGNFFSLFSCFVFLIVLWLSLWELEQAAVIMGSMMRKESFSTYLKVWMNVAGMLTCLMWFIKKETALKNISEYHALLLATVLGGHLLVMSNHFTMIFLSLELISICAYVLVGYSNTKLGSEGSLKYFLFESVASAIMLYGLSLLYGLTGTLDFSSREFADLLIQKNGMLAWVAGIMVTAGFLYKIASAPMHLWAPDAYEASPMPVLAFLSVAPKLAGLGVLTKFMLIMNLYSQSLHDWQVFIAGIAMLTLTIGNFSALAQKSPKRMMAYSSIAQSGFLLTGLAAFLPEGLQFMLFYAAIYVVMNFIVLIYLEYFESKGIYTIPHFSGIGKQETWPMIMLLIGLIALTGLPPTAGFTAKLLVFTSLWESYELSEKSILLWLLIFGLLNTVVSLFYYLKIPYYAFLKSGEFKEKQNNIRFTNFLGIILVFLILILFFMPGLLMGWINKINFVL